MSGGAAVLAEIFGTEKDKVNCAFYFKIGACRHGDRCTRLHHKPTYSQTILLCNMYQNPFAQATADDPGNTLDMSPEEQEYFDAFYEDVYLELWHKYGDIEEMNVCGNLGDHLIGNVYVKFRSEDDADKAATGLNNRWYNGQPIFAELSPVTDFREACCRQYEQRECTRGGFCNFMHILKISDPLRRKMRSVTRMRSPPAKYVRNTERQSSRSRSPQNNRRRR
uniref:Splicing factor U2AF 26 kDa subunit (Trinotate prediction) n=1 Tax=Myxobolus squamalis TaxID=59785 RepID=A0A6B2G0H6_MYXSQ